MLPSFFFVLRRDCLSVPDEAAADAGVPPGDAAAPGGVTEENTTPSLSLVSITSPGFNDAADVTTFPSFLVIL